MTCEILANTPTTICNLHDRVGFNCCVIFCIICDLNIDYMRSVTDELNVSESKRRNEPVVNHYSDYMQYTSKVILQPEILSVKRLLPGLSAVSDDVRPEW